MIEVCKRHRHASNESTAEAVSNEEKIALIKKSVDTNACQKLGLATSSSAYKICLVSQKKENYRDELNPGKSNMSCILNH